MYCTFLHSHLLPKPLFLPHYIQFRYKFTRAGEFLEAIFSVSETQVSFSRNRFGVHMMEIEIPQACSKTHLVK